MGERGQLGFGQLVRDGEMNHKKKTCDMDSGSGTLVEKAEG